METSSPLDNENAYNNAVKSIVDSNLKRKTEENGSNKLTKKIRKTALTPIHFLAEDPTFYNYQQTKIKIESLNALILLRDSSEQSVKRICANPSCADQFTSCSAITTISIGPSCPTSPTG